LKNQKFKRPEKEDLPKKLKEKITDVQAEVLLEQMEEFAELIIEHLKDYGQ